MSETAKSRNGQDLPILSLATAVYQTIDGTGGHAESSVLEPGKYRIAISESAGNNAFINISESGIAAETGKGASGIFAYDCLWLASDVYQPPQVLAISEPDLCLSL